MTKEFFDDPRRGYGPSIGTVFSKLKNSGFSNVYGPAKEQFKGQGSCGNGSAMRISPVGLFGFKDDETLVKVCRYMYQTWLGNGRQWILCNAIVHCHNCLILILLLLGVYWEFQADPCSRQWGEQCTAAGHGYSAGSRD